MKKALVVLVFVMLATALLHASSLAQTESRKIRLVTREISLGKVLHDADTRRLIVSPDGKRVAYVAKRGEKVFVVVDGEEGKEYDWVGNPIFSPDGRWLAYEANQGEKQLVVVDGVEGKEYNEIDNFLFSSDSKRVAYVAKRGEKVFVVVDGEEGKEYDWVGNPIFSPDGRRLAYEANQGEKLLVVVDGKEGKEYDALEEAGIIHGKDGLGISYNAGGVLLFSPDSRHVAYVAKQSDGWWVAVLDSMEGKAYSTIGTGIVLTGERAAPDFVFSPDSKKLAYKAMRGGKALVVVNDAEGKEYDHIGAHSLCFSPDGRRLAYSAKRSKWWLGLEQSSEGLVVVDEVEGKAYDWCANYPALIPVFSPDSARVAYCARRSEKWLVVVDGIEGKQYDAIGRVIFSSDSKRVAYRALRKRQVDNEFFVGIVGKWFVVVDGEEGKEYDEFFSELVFDSPTLLHTLARWGRKIFRVEIEIVE